MQNELKNFIELAQLLLKEEDVHPVSTPIPPSELLERLDLSLEEEGLSEEALRRDLEDLIRYTPKTASRKFFNQLFGGRQAAAVLGDLLSVMLNNSMYTYKVAGPQVGVEKVLIDKIAGMIGYAETADGTFAPGGSLANFMALLMARDRINRDIIDSGMQGRLVAFTSAESHYSNHKNASFAGIGRNNVRLVACDSAGRMIPEELERAIQDELDQGSIPFFVNLTAGTTVLGAFDPIPPIADICNKHGLWLHVDGAYCGAVFLSSKHGHFLRGMERSDSFCFNAHKMLGTPLTCSILITQKRDDLLFSFGNEADYLYQTAEDEYNLGKTSLQCGRRNDALKLWTLWKALGTRGLEAMVDKQFDLAEAGRNYVREHVDYELISDAESISVCFNYKGIDPRKLCTLLYEESQLMVGYGSFRQKDFIRLVTINSSNSVEDILQFFATLEQFVVDRPELFPESVN